MARRGRREEARDDRQARDRRRDEEARDDRAKRKKPPPKKDHDPGPAKTTTERLKALSKQSGPASMAAAPGTYPPDPVNAQAVFTTGPGPAYEYNYVRVDQSGAEDYALATSQQSAPVPPIAGFGQTLTSGAANNPT